MTLFVAELGVNHLGSLNLALKMIEVAAETGCDFVKLHHKDVDTFYSKEKLAQPYDSPYGKTWGEYRRLFEFGILDFDQIQWKSVESGIPWFATAQDWASLDLLFQYDLPMYKIASCNAREIKFLYAMSKRVPTDKPIVLSVGGSTLGEIEEALSNFPEHDVYLLHCVSEYPVRPARLRLGNIPILKREFGDTRIRIGYSGHEEGILASLAAIDLGAEMVERHFCLSRHSFVHYIECALEPVEYEELIILARTTSDLSILYQGLPPEAFESSFGMSEQEEAFLVRHTYGVSQIPSEAGFDGR